MAREEDSGCRCASNKCWRDGGWTACGTEAANARTVSSEHIMKGSRTVMCVCVCGLVWGVATAPAQGSSTQPMQYSDTSSHTCGHGAGGAGWAQGGAAAAQSCPAASSPPAEPAATWRGRTVGGCCGPRNPSVQSSPACVKMASPPGWCSTYELTSYTWAWRGGGASVGRGSASPRVPGRVHGAPHVRDDCRRARHPGRVPAAHLQLVGILVTDDDPQVALSLVLRHLFPAVAALLALLGGWQAQAAGTAGAE